MERLEHKSEEALPFRQGLFETTPDGSGWLTANRCERCQITYFPKRDFCIKCLTGDHLKEVKLSRKGLLHTFTVVHRATPDFATPYIVGYVDLEQDGVRIFAPLTDCEPDDLKIGMEMELVFGPSHKKPDSPEDKSRLIYKFKPVGR